MIRNFVKWMLRIVQDEAGSPSSMRIMSLAVVLDMVVCWTVVVIRTGKFVPWGYDNAFLVLSVLGAKAAQVYGERRGPRPPRNGE